MTKLFINGTDTEYEEMHYDFINDRIAISAATLENTGGGSGGGDSPAPPREEVPEGVVLGGEITDWDSQSKTVLTIPRGQAIASKFRTSAEGRAGGIVTFQTPTGQAGVSTDVWVSKTPGGSPISDQCSLGGQSFAYSFRWAQFDFRDYICTLEPNTTYYINMRHTDPDQEASKVVRKT